MHKVLTDAIVGENHVKQIYSTCACIEKLFELCLYSFNSALDCNAVPSVHPIKSFYTGLAAT